MNSFALLLTEERWKLLPGATITYSFLHFKPWEEGAGTATHGGSILTCQIPEKLGTVNRTVKIAFVNRKCVPSKRCN